MDATTGQYTEGGYQARGKPGGFWACPSRARGIEIVPCTRAKIVDLLIQNTVPLSPASNSSTWPRAHGHVLMVTCSWSRAHGHLLAVPGGRLGTTLPSGRSKRPPNAATPASLFSPSVPSFPIPTLLPPPSSLPPFSFSKSSIALERRPASIQLKLEARASRSRTYSGVSAKQGSRTGSKA